MLDTHRQAHHAFSHTSLRQFGSIELAVCGGCRVCSQRFGIANVHEAGKQLQRIEKTRTGGTPAIALEAE